MNRADQIELVGRVIQGDLSAFEILVHRHTPSLLHFIRGIVGDEHGAEDVAQQVWIRAYQNLPRFDACKGSFLTWVFRIARNESFNVLRSRCRSPVRFQTPRSEPEIESDPSRRVIEREEFAMLDRALANLPAEQRTAWALSELNGLSQAEIAEIEDAPIGTVKSRVARAKRSLQRQLNQDTPPADSRVKHE
ncbi:MAG: sigma-70 family RNA polymerase sigma factor [Planctomycetota bacterium]